MRLEELNHWWKEKRVKEEFIPITKRQLFHEIKKDLERKQIQVIVGLRRVGKSTILFQLIDELIKNNVNPKNIIYCSFDEPELREKRIEEILREYSKITGTDYKNEKIYLFIDEVQKSKNWIDSTKLIYDNLPNIKILISGSASLNILAEAKKSLAGRAIYYHLKPLSFKEYLEFKGMKIEEKEILIYKETLEREFENFLWRSFPEIINETDKIFIKNYIRNSIIEPVILKDLPKEFKNVDIDLVENLINIFFKEPGQYLDVENLSKELRRGKKTIYQTLFYMEFSFLIKRIFNFRPSVRLSSRKLQKVYAFHHSLLLPFDVAEDRLIENLVAYELDARYYWRDKIKEVDFLKDFIPVEVKFREKVKDEDLRWVKEFLEKYGKLLNVSKGYIITKNDEGKIDNIELVPIWLFSFRGI
jgi:predicted AAA+ superfamily ATPase